ncbi:hypothetical protein diail_1754 [Diaporthe ilicicola]|nr:hypothetical protein diail_1754 [Diaporthe ilicicola]
MTSTKDSPSTATEDTSISVLPTDTSQPTITDPVQSEDLPGDDDDILAIDLSSLSISPPQPDSTTEHITLPLLQPLSTPAMLAACRNPSSRIVRIPNGRASDARGPELLDITALGNTWRHALSKLPPPAAVTFDLTLPKPTPAEGERSADADADADALPRVHWATSTGSAVAVAVEQVKVMRLVVTLASATWVRRSGKDVRFDVVYGADDEPSQRAVEGLRQQLDGIGGFRGGPMGAMRGV